MATSSRLNMDDTWNYIINEIQNWEFRIEDIILHSLTGVFFAIGVKIKQIIKKFLSLF
jgi:hypothetical protein